MKPYLNIQEAIRDFSDRIERLEAALKVLSHGFDSMEERIQDLELKTADKGINYLEKEAANGV